MTDESGETYCHVIAGVICGDTGSGACLLAPASCEAISGAEQPGGEPTPAEALRAAVDGCVVALDRAHAAGKTIPPQAHSGVAALALTVQLLEAQRDQLPASRD